MLLDIKLIVSRKVKDRYFLPYKAQAIDNSNKKHLTVIIAQHFTITS